MKFARAMPLLVILLVLLSTARAQDLQPIKAVWQQTLDALAQGNSQKATTLFADFNQKVRAYVTANGRTWQIEYLVGSLNCQFPDTRGSGAKFLADILQNNRGLNEAGQKELKRQLAACTAAAPAATPVRSTHPDLPRDIADASAHFQSPGVHGDMKGGYSFKVENEAAVAISPIPASELLSRRVPLTDPQRALSAGVARLPSGAVGATLQEFAVITPGGSESVARNVGQCLTTYTPALKQQFHMQPVRYMVTVYTADTPEQVYRYAHLLHGLQLPQGVVAYSVPEDMSLAGVGFPDACGSLAHELVHLLIKSSLPVSPAWLEEGLASQVAVAWPSPNKFTFSWSWRDDTLQQNFGLRPSVAELLDAPWASFSPENNFDMPRAAAVQAMASVFIRYLQTHGKLSDVYFAVRDQHFSPDLSQYKSYREIVEENLGKNITQIDADFGEWFQQQKLSHSRPTRTATENLPNAPPGVCNVPANISASAQISCEPQPMINQRKIGPPPSPPKAN